jgi:hypothetical protein
MFGLSQTSDVGRVGTQSGSGLGQEIELCAHERTAPGSGLRCPIYNCVYKGLSLTDRI